MPLDEQAHETVTTKVGKGKGRGRGRDWGALEEHTPWRERGAGRINPQHPSLPALSLPLVPPLLAEPEWEPHGNAVCSRQSPLWDRPQGG